MKKQTLSISVIMMGMMLFLSACGGGSSSVTPPNSGNNDNGDEETTTGNTVIERATPSLRSFMGHAFDGRSHLTGPADISAATQAQTGHLIVNDGPALGFENSLYVGTTTGLKAFNATNLGTERWASDTADYAAPAITPDHYIISGTEGKVVAFDDKGATESHTEFTVEGTVSQVATDASGNIYVIEGNNLQAFNVTVSETDRNDFSLERLYGPIDLEVTITRPILVHEDKLILGTDDSVLVRNKANGAAIDDTITDISTTQSFVIHPQTDSVLVGSNEALKKISLADASITTLRDEDLKHYSNTVVDSNGTIYVVEETLNGVFGFDELGVDFDRSFSVVKIDSNGNATVEVIENEVSNSFLHATLGIDESFLYVMYLIQDDSDNYQYKVQQIELANIDGEVVDDQLKTKVLTGLNLGNLPTHHSGSKPRLTIGNGSLFMSGYLDGGRDDGDDDTEKLLKLQ